MTDFEGNVKEFPGDKLKPVEKLVKKRKKLLREKTFEW